jgi:uncharacterized protein YjbI with pentapeptide repeats
MANLEHVELLSVGVEAWNAWRKANPEIRPDLSGLDLTNANLVGINFSGVDLREACLAGANFSDADFSPCMLNKNEEGRLVLRPSIPGTWQVSNDLIKEVASQGAHLTPFVAAYPDGGRGYYADLRGVRAGNAKFNGANLSSTFLSGAIIAGADLGGVNLNQAVLFGTSLVNSDLTGATFSGIRLGSTNLELLRFDLQHPVLNDGSHEVLIPLRDRMLNWSKLRSIGAFPFFSVSWASLAISIFVINGIGFLNEHPPLQSSNQVIPIPTRMTLVLLSSLLLVVGSTSYRLLCPSRIQEFSETEWVERHRYPRLLYLAASYKRSGQWLAFLATGIGGALGALLLSERLLKALNYALTQLGLFG